MWLSRVSAKEQFCSLANASRKSLVHTTLRSQTTKSRPSSLSLDRKLRERSLRPLEKRRRQHHSSRAPPAETNEEASLAQSREHSSYGPHKEYFQDPGQAPRPDFSPYVRSKPSQASAPFVPPPPSYLQHHPNAQSPGGQQSTHTTYFQDSSSVHPVANSFSRRFVRSSFYSLLFLSLGVVAGTGLITWEYLSPMFEEGSEAEAELVEHILETMDDHSLIFELREDGWKEVDLSSPNMVSAGRNVRSLAGDLSVGSGQDGAESQPHSQPNVVGLQGKAEGVGMGRSMLYQILTGTKGLVGMRMFHHPSQDYSIMVFFAGFGIEGWPDLTHGGMITTLLEEAVQKHIDWHHRGQFERVLDVGVKVDFKSPVQSGEVYAILVPPALVESVRDPNNLGLTQGSLQSGINKMKLVGLFMQLEGAPKVSSGVTQQGGVSVEHQIEVPGRGTSGPAIHAVGEITLKVVAGRESGTQQQDLLKSIANGNASLLGSPSKNRQISED